MKILMLNSQGSGVGYYRFWLPAAALQRRGHDVRVFPGSDVALEHIANKGDVGAYLMAQMTEVDVIHSGYSGSEGHIRLMASAREYAASLLNRNVPLLTDCDDDFLHVPDYNQAFSLYHGGAKMWRLNRLHLNISDATTVSTSPLLKVFERETPRLYHLPNCFDPAPWEAYASDPRRQEDKSIRLMFAGNRGRIADIDSLQEPIETLMHRYDGQEGKPLLRLVFQICLPKWATQWMTNPKEPEANRAFLLQPCDYRTYWGEMKWVAPDIFVNPVVPNQFNASKSFIKLYDAVLAGSAYVGTDWETHAPVPADVMMKCSTPAQWTESIAYLIEDGAARQKWANRLKEWAFDSYHIDHHIEKWERAYEECAKIPVIRTLEQTAGR